MCLLYIISFFTLLHYFIRVSVLLFDSNKCIPEEEIKLPLPREGQFNFFRSLDCYIAAHEMRPEDIGMGLRDYPDKQPFIVGYFKSSGVREAKIRQKRDAKRKKKSEATSWDYRNNPYTGKSAHETSQFLLTRIYN